MDALARFLEMARAAGMWDGVPALYRPLLLAALRRDPNRTAHRLDQLAALWQAAKETEPHA